MTSDVMLILEAAIDLVKQDVQASTPRKWSDAASF
jgi:hypothetical protein